MSAQAKMRSFEVVLDRVDGTWSEININYYDGRRETISRSNIDAFLRLKPMLEEIKQVEETRDQLNRLFPTKPR